MCCYIFKKIFTYILEEQAQRELIEGNRREVLALRGCIFKREGKGRKQVAEVTNRSYRWIWRVTGTVTCSMHGRGEIHTQFL
jgi:hypothetical protein